MTGPLRVAYVLKHFPAVSETFVINELAELRRRGVDIRILALDRPAGLEHPFVADSGLDRLVCYQPDVFDDFLDVFRPHLVHAHFATVPTELARRQAARLGLPYTFTAHGGDIYRQPPADFAIRARQSSGVITVSEANVAHMTGALGVPRAVISLVPNGVDTNVFCPRGSGREEPPIVLCVARLHPVKNHRLLLEACHDLLRQDVAFKCVLVGEGLSRSYVEAARADLGLAHVVTLVGACTQWEVAQWMTRSTVAVLTSDSEGFPVCLLEASASGLPIVATSVGGVSEIVDHGVTGWLCPAGDRAGIATALARLLTDPVEAAAMGRRGRARTVARYTLEQQVNGLLDAWGAIPGLGPVVQFHARGAA